MLFYHKARWPRNFIHFLKTPVALAYYSVSFHLMDITLCFMVVNTYQIPMQSKNPPNISLELYDALPKKISLK